MKGENLKKIVFLLVVIFTFSISVFAETAETLIKKVYENNDKINTIDATIQNNSEETNIVNGKIKRKNDTRRLVFNKKNTHKKETITTQMQPEKKKSALLDKKINSTLQPECVFNMKEYFKDYDLKIKIKDEKIKRGGEEIIATRKDQKIQYPQIRIFIKKGNVQNIKFYTLTGKNYYEVKINKFELFGDVNVPVEITEIFKAENNQIINVIKYTNIKFNTL